MLAVDFL